MNTKLFKPLIILMTISLLGIIFVQGYWIVDSYKAKEDQFTQNVKQVLISVSKKIENRETEEYYDLYSNLIDTLEIPSQFEFTELIYKIKQDRNDETFIFSDGILEEEYKLPFNIFNLDFDSISIKRLTSRISTTTITPGLDGNSSIRTKKVTFKRLKDYERSQFENAYSDISSKTPIHKRVSPKEINRLLSYELQQRGLSTNFEFAVYDKDFATTVISDDFKLDPTSTYRVPLLVNDEFDTGYQLYVNFSDKKKVLLNSIIVMTILSLAFTSIIVFTYANAFKQLSKQRQISQIKTDFINNMTHEFKTPIATINLALDALKNPKVKGDQDFIDRYHGMIREENRRMHAQVENVLRISKLENNELDLEKGEVKLHDLIEDAITHISLIVEDRGGYIKTHFNASKSSINVSEVHFTNVIVNMLDNAIKYSEEAPKIDVFTENVGNTIVLKIKDQGIGMSKSVQKKIFEKFYREHMGNIHNVKGHGLGLSYVKRMLDEHNAQITVESEQNLGSTFNIKINLIS